MWTLIVYLVAPFLAAPLIMYGSRHLFAIFVREGAELFVNMDIHKPWAMNLGTDIAIVNALIFAGAWWGAVGLASFQMGSLLIAGPFIVALAVAIMITSTVVKNRLKISAREAYMVGLLTCAGGNLPLIIATPLLVMLVNSQDIAMFTMEAPLD